jgi:hypothetical protein
MSISSKNSSSSPLNDGVTFTGQTEEIVSWTSIFVSCKTDQSCALYIDHSSDGSNWDFTDIIPITGGTALFQSLESKAKYFRVRLWNNSGSNQTYLRLQTILRPVETNVTIDDGSVHATTNASDSSMLVYGYHSGNNYPLLTDNTGKLQVDIASMTASDLDIRALTSADEVTVYPKAGQVFPVSDNGGSLTVDGTVSVSSMPTTTVTATSLDIRPLTTSDEVLATVSNVCDSWRNLNVGTTSSQIGSTSTVTRIVSLHAFNNSASKKYVKLYAGSSADETDTPLLTLTVKSEDQLVLNFPYPLSVDDSMCVRATSGLLDSDTGTPTSNDVVLNVLYSGN